MLPDFYTVNQQMQATSSYMFLNGFWSEFFWTKSAKNPVFSRLPTFCPIITQSSILLTIPVAFNLFYLLKIYFYDSVVSILHLESSMHPQKEISTSDYDLKIRRNSFHCYLPYYIVKSIGGSCPQLLPGILSQNPSLDWLTQIHSFIFTSFSIL